MQRRVAVTGMGGISPLGNDANAVFAQLKTLKNCVRVMDEWAKVEGLNTRLGAPAAAFTLPDAYNRKKTRSMGRVGIMACRASELALTDAGLLNDPILTGGRAGVSYGSSAGEPAAVASMSNLICHNKTEGINANTYLRMMAHTAPVNIAVFFGLTGRVYTTSSACTSGSQGIGYAYEAIKFGKADVMIAGGSEELDASDAAVFDTLFATSTQNDAPESTPRPFDRDRDGLVIGEGAGTLILEEWEHAKARGATIYAEVIGFGTNCDGAHVTQPQASTMAQAMRLALADADLPPEAVGYVNAHGTATERGDIAESHATREVFGDKTPVSTLKGYMGHTLGAAGSLEAWMTLEMMRREWFSPNINLVNVDERCAELDYLTGEGREIRTDVVMSNNFAFGGINTSLIFRRVI
jgi:3-oxoacyl-[acyl-carrier-protein] synthase II